MQLEIDDTVPARAYETLTEWDGASVYHTREWHQVLCEAFGWRVRALLLSEGGKLRAWLPIVKKRRMGRSIWVALPLSHHIGFVRAPGVDLSGMPLERLPRPLELHAAAPAAGFTAMHQHVVTVAELSSHRDEASLLGSLAREKRAQVRKAARKGVEVVRRTDPRAFDLARAFTVTTRHRQGSPMYPRAFFPTLARVLAPRGLASVHLASVDGAPASMVLTLTWGDSSIYAYGADDGSVEHRRRFVNQAALWDAIRTAHADGRPRFDYGSSPGHQEGLIRYKERMGGTTTPLEHAALSRSGRGSEVDQGGTMVRAGVRLLQSTPLLPFEHLSPALLRLVV